jgi:hypothetical protein
MARIGPLDGKLGEIVGMRDPDQVAVAPQAGGGRRRKSRRNNNNGLNRINTALLVNAPNAPAVYEVARGEPLNANGLNAINAEVLVNAPNAPAAYNVARGQRKNRKASRKNRKASRKNRKASRKNRKASRKNRKASRKASRRNARRNNMNMMGGSYPGDGAPLSAPNMLLSASQAAKAGTADFSNPWMRN